MTDNASFEFGGVVYPLTSALTNSLIRDVDPAIYWALDYWKTVLNTHLSARLAAQAAAIGAPITTAVLATSHIDPGPRLIDHPEHHWPLLATYRLKDVFTQHTITWDSSDSEWEIAYVLPGLAWSQSLLLLPILRAVAVTIRNRTEAMWDPSWNSGAKPWGSSYANLKAILINDATYGAYEDGKGLIYSTVKLRALVSERLQPAPTGVYQTLAGVDVNYDNTAETQTTLTNVVQTETDF